MKRILFAAVAIAPLAACTYVEERPGYAPAPTAAYGYTPGYAAPGYGYVAPAPAYAQRGSYEAERQAYEYGRRDGAAAAQGWR